MLSIGLTLLGVIVGLVVIAAVSDLRRRRRNEAIKDPNRIWLPIRETRRDVQAYRALSRGSGGPGTGWMDDRRR
ncbi:hypothetical protein GCM10027176_22190 [Actinoallomurus bryophytorum]|uniref:Uncharacterized protein n=1 Tax=Actinoallomurus bryophytorum TaxID=1490222 RepID=A0A543CWH3_9ACTN|nr:hypothetical protein [Actinoallomurus bryophytorum]TQM01450.1 hypothetical protein FB559_7209 [Actinoallomurus bryophytorum]